MTRDMLTKGISLKTCLLVKETDAVLLLKIIQSRGFSAPENQRGDTAKITFGRAVASVCAVDRDETKLGRFCWTKLGGSGKTKYMIKCTCRTTKRTLILNSRRRGTNTRHIVPAKAW